MKASETNFKQIIEGTTQYMVPLFQRPYEWDKPQWETLWEDLFGLIESENAKNLFIGSIVTIPIANVPQDINKYTLIDGQQRLTTISILLSVLRDLATQQSNNELYLATQQLNKKLAAKINKMLINSDYDKEDSEYLKLLPTQVDRNAFKQLIEESNGSQNYKNSQIVKCHDFFTSKLKFALKSKKYNKIDLQQLYLIIINKLSIVNIVIDSEDNPYIVFESLNAKSRPLTQADLIRNYFFMLIPVEEQEQCYADYWLPMQEQLQDTLTDFVRHYIMSFGKIVVQRDIYSTLKYVINKSNVLPELIRLSKFANYYYKIINPKKETNLEISQALQRLNQTEITVAYPFLLKCYDDYAAGKLASDDFKRILHLVENFILRRFVCNIPSKELDKIFPFLYREAEAKTKVNSSSLINGVSLVLQQKGYPEDEEFIPQLANTKFYVRGQKIRTGLILESIECAYANKEPTAFNFQDLTIEHILPKNINGWWQQHLGEDWQTTHELYLHTLGNLTLIKGNSELLNKDFPTKKQCLQNSSLEMNRYFATVSTWTKEDIEKRSEALAALALKVWPYFGDPSIKSYSSGVTGYGVTGKKPTKLRFMDLDIFPKTWKEVLIETLEKIIEVESEGFIKVVEEYPNILSKEAFAFIKPHQLKNGYYVKTNLSAEYVYKFCIQAIEAVGISSEEWKIDYR